MHADQGHHQPQLRRERNINSGIGQQLRLLLKPFTSIHHLATIRGGPS